VQTHPHSTRRWPLRLLAAVPGLLVSAIVVATEIPAVREAIGIASTIYRFINSTVPSFGVAAIWVGFALFVGGAAAAWWFHRSIKEETIKVMAVGSAVLAVALGGLVAVVSTFNQHGLPTAGHNYTAAVTKHHHASHHRRHHRPAAHTPSSGGSKPASPASSTPSSPPTTPSTTPAPSSAPAPAGSASGDSGGNNNTITVEKDNHQEATTGTAEGSGATSGPATNNNNEGPVNITVG
jgi:hypothetical protein